MTASTYISRRGELETYFDRTAADAWAKLTSDAPVSGVRATVRAGRDAMRQQLLNWLPTDLSGRRILDAGCGAGQFAVEAAQRGATVTAVDLSPTLLDLARARYNAALEESAENASGRGSAGMGASTGKIEFMVGDFVDEQFGAFDHIVAMDSLIHYEPTDITRTIERLADRTSQSIVFTVAPKTPLLSVMHKAGKLFPNGDRSPAIIPIKTESLRKNLSENRMLSSWRAGRDARINSGFYISHAMEFARS